MKQAGDVLLGRYRLIERLGQGGMGEVWRAEHLALKSLVAVKMLYAGEHNAGSRGDAEKRFEREARAAATLRSPHVVQITDHGIDEGVPFIVMELLEGETLAKRLAREHVLLPSEALRIVTHVGRALSKAHEQGIVHRDVKPENIFIVRNDDDEITKLVDFGVVKVDGRDLSNVSATKSGAIVGTPLYMSPEQLRAKAVDPRSDVWSLAIVAFECLCGTTPFLAESLADLIVQITRERPPAPSSFATVPTGFDEWFFHATERDPAVRFTTVKEAVDALKAVIDTAPDIRARIIAERIAIAESPTLAASTTSIARPRPRRTVFLLGGIAVAMGIVVVVLLTRPPRVVTTTTTVVPSTLPSSSATTENLGTQWRDSSIVTLPAPSVSAPPTASSSALNHKAVPPKPKPTTTPSATVSSNPLAF